MWEVTDADQLRWQAAAITRLSTLVRMAGETGLPVLTWTVGPTGGLVGAVIGPDADRRTAFELWAAAIGANRRREHTNPSEVTRLYAAALNEFGTAEVAITATLFPPDDTDAETTTGSDVR